MGADKEFWLHRGLFWEFVDALTVGGRGVAASWRFANEHEKRPIPRKPRPRHGCLILEGVLAPKVPYCSLEEVLRNKLGVDVFIADMGFINIHSRFQMMRLARESFLHTLEVENLDQIVLIGHSIGGLIALMLLGQYPERIKKIFCIASPINVGAQTPWKALSWIISTFVARPHLQKKALDNIIQRAIPYAEKVVTISTARDIILPNKATHFPFPGAKNYVYDAKGNAFFYQRLGEEMLQYVRRRLEYYYDTLSGRHLFWMENDREKFRHDVRVLYENTALLFDSTILDTHAGLPMHPFTLDVILRTLRGEKN